METGNTKRDKEIEVTPAMVEAGLPWLDRYEGDSSDSARCLADIFRAMYVAQVEAPENVQVVA